MNFRTLKKSEAGVASGTSLWKRINATYEELKSIFGKPTYPTGDGYKTDVEWVIKLDNGTVFTIYNWKDGKHYLGTSGLSKSQITDWHIGLNQGDPYASLNAIRFLKSVGLM